MQLNSESLLRKVKQALDEEDVEGLLALGCPRDEYDEEARLITAQIRSVTEFGDKALELSEAVRVVEDVCNKAFGPFEGIDLERHRPVWRAVAKRIVGV